MAKRIVLANYALFLSTTLFFIPAFVATGSAILSRIARLGGDDTQHHFNNQVKLGWWWIRWTIPLMFLCVIIANLFESTLLLLPAYIPSFLLIPKAWSGFNYARLEEMPDTDLAESRRAPISQASTGGQLSSESTRSVKSDLLNTDRETPPEWESYAAAFKAAKDDLEAQIKVVVPLIREKAQEILGKTGTTILEYGVERLLIKIHGLLPWPFRLVVRRKRFVAFCLAHEEMVFGELLEGSVA